MGTYEEEDDEARKEYTRLAMDGGLIRRNSDIEDIIGNAPFVVIGHFAYTVGYDGCIWMAPIILETISDRTVTTSGRAISVKYPNWNLSVNLGTSGISVGITKIGIGRLASVIADASNVSDIMAQSGVLVETDKRV